MPKRKRLKSRKANSSIFVIFDKKKVSKIKMKKYLEAVEELKTSTVAKDRQAIPGSSSEELLYVVNDGKNAMKFKQTIDKIKIPSIKVSVIHNYGIKKLPKYKSECYIFVEYKYGSVPKEMWDKYEKIERKYKNKVKVDGSGTFLDTMISDISYSGKTIKVAKQFKRDINKLKIKTMKVTIKTHDGKRVI